MGRETVSNKQGEKIEKKINGKTETDPQFSIGFMDMVQMDKTREDFRIIHNTKIRTLLLKVTHYALDLRSL